MELREVIETTDMETPALKRLYPHLDPETPPIPDGSRNLPLRWHGGSSAPAYSTPEAYTPRVLAQDIQALLAQLGIESLHYVSNSLGGLVGYELLQLGQPRILSLTTFGTTAELHSPRMVYWTVVATPHLLGVKGVAALIEKTTTQDRAVGAQLRAMYRRATKDALLLIQGALDKDINAAQRRRFTYAGELRLWLNRASGHRLLAATDGEALAGVAIVKSSSAKTVLCRQLIGAVLPRAPRLVGLLGDMRWRQIWQIKPAMNLSVALPTPYYTLDILAVSPDFQGQGIGRLLLDNIHAQCDADAQAAGIYLYTGDEKNVHIYRRFDYEVLEENQVRTLTIWHMFRPHPARDATAFFAALREAAPEKSPARWREFALPALGAAGVLIGLALLWRWLRSCNKQRVA